MQTLTLLLFVESLNHELFEQGLVPLVPLAGQALEAGQRVLVNEVPCPGASVFQARLDALELRVPHDLPQVPVEVAEVA